MCGMAGHFSALPDLEWVDKTLSEHVYRGPDNSKSAIVSENLIMGANRLAMVDPRPRSNQPMKSGVCNSMITFNGEIYNFKTLKKELLEEGNEFSTDSDTEVLMVGLRNYGISFLNKVNGMYAIAFFDEKEGTLLLSRDQLGKKPLYFVLRKKEVKWSSNLQSLISTDSKISSIGLHTYFRYGYSIDPKTIYSEVQAVPPGYSIKINLSTLDLKIVRTPQLCSIRQNNLRDALTDAILSRVYEQDKIGISLSGGLDSTLIAHIGSQLGLNLISFTAKWSDSDKDRYNRDADAAKKIASALNIEHHEVEMMNAEELPEKLRLYISAMEEPNNNPTGLSMMDLYKCISSFGIRLTLTGDGADEIFSGYDRYRISKRIPKFLNIHSNAWVSSSNNVVGKSARRFLAAQFDEKNYSYWGTWHELFSPKEISRLTGLKGILSENHIFEKMNPYPAKQTWEKLENQDLSVWIAMESNRRLDRISMFHSIEARSPFQDDNIVNLALNNRATHSFKSKHELFLKEFPELSRLPILTTKTGFVSPIGHWLRVNESYVNNRVKYLIRELNFDVTYLSELQLSPKRGDFDAMKKLWALLILAVWHEKNGFPIEIN